MKVSRVSVFIVLLVAFRICAAQSAFPTVVHYESPISYPPVAEAVRALGLVQVRLEVNERGKVIVAEAVSGHPLLKKVSEIAAKKWTFTPTPGLHTVMARIVFVDPKRGTRQRFDVVGQYSIVFTPEYYEILNTPSYNSN